MTKSDNLSKAARLWFLMARNPATREDLKEAAKAVRRRVRKGIRMDKEKVLGVIRSKVVKRAECRHNLVLDPDARGQVAAWFLPVLLDMTENFDKHGRWFPGRSPLV